MSFAKAPSVENSGKPASTLSDEDRQELQNVKELCLTIIKGQKRLVREIDKVKESFDQNPFAGIDSASDTTRPPVVITPQRHQVTIQDVRELEEKQKKNLKAHLIALDMKEQGKDAVPRMLLQKMLYLCSRPRRRTENLAAAMRAYVNRMENRILESLEATKHDYVGEQDSVCGLRSELQSTALRMDDFMGSLEDRMADFEGRLDRESEANTSFRTGLQHHLGVTTDVSQQEGFEIISIVENTPMVFATPYRPQPKEEDIPLFPREAPRDRKNKKSCFVVPRFLRRSGPHPRLD